MDAVPGLRLKAYLEVRGGNKWTYKYSKRDPNWGFSTYNAINNYLRT